MQIKKLEKEEKFGTLSAKGRKRMENKRRERQQRAKERRLQNRIEHDNIVSLLSDDDSDDEDDDEDGDILNDVERVSDYMVFRFYRSGDDKGKTAVGSGQLHFCVEYFG